VKRLAAEQMRFYPNDLVFIRYVSGVLLNAYRYSEIVTLLEPTAKQKSDYQIEGKLGFALVMRGRKVEGIKYLESAISKEPRNYWAYSALGYAHVYTGTPKNAVPYFKKVLEIRPGFPEIQDMLVKISAPESQRSTR
jgi:tetratricopeptide (TPR) repeat protein